MSIMIMIVLNYNDDSFNINKNNNILFYHILIVAS